MKVNCKSLDIMLKNHVLVQICLQFKSIWTHTALVFFGVSLGHMIFESPSIRVGFVAHVTTEWHFTVVFGRDVTIQSLLVRILFVA